MSWKIATRRAWFNPAVNPALFGPNASNQRTPRVAMRKNKYSAADSSGDGVFRRTRAITDEGLCWATRDLLTRRLKANSEFRKRYRCNVPMYQQFPDAMRDAFTIRRCKLATRSYGRRTKRERYRPPLREVAATRFNQAVNDARDFRPTATGCATKAWKIGQSFEDREIACL